MTTKSLARIAGLFAILFAIAFIGGMQHAAAGDSRFAFADKQASIALVPGATTASVSGLPPNSELLYVMRGTKRLLGIYAGDQPDTRNTGKESPSKETISGRTALTYLASNEHGRSRQTFVEARDNGWPNVIHFFYSGESPEDAAMADKMIESLQIASPAPRK